MGLVLSVLSWDIFKLLSVLVFPSNEKTTTGRYGVLVPVHQNPPLRAGVALYEHYFQQVERHVKIFVRADV
jgi:hypothetical protein